MNVSQALGSLRDVRVETQVTKSGANFDPTADNVYMAFLPQGTAPATFPSADWNAGSWETVGVAPFATYNALCLVGPGGIFTPSARGTYGIWIRVADTPEVPAELVGTLTVY